MPANNTGGPQKVSAVAALDLARNGYNVTLFLPVLPYYYYFVSLGNRPIAWLRAGFSHVKAWVRIRRFTFQDVISQGEMAGRVRVKFVLRQASSKQLQGLDYLIIHSIAQVSEYLRRFPQERQIYLLHHPEEQQHGHAKEFQRLRESFEGKILVISPFTAREVKHHVLDPPVVPNPISPQVWRQRDRFDPTAPRRDVLLFWKEGEAGLFGSEVLLSLKKLRPHTTSTVWCRGSGTSSLVQQSLPGVDLVENLSEDQLCDLYVSHSLLLFCSNYEGFGMPPIEAMACGCVPVLNPDVGAAELYARDDYNAVFLNGTADETAFRLASLLDKPESLKAMGANAVGSIDAFNPDGYGCRLLAAAGIL